MTSSVLWRRWLGAALRVRIRGAEHLRTGRRGLLVAANHQGPPDPLALALSLPAGTLFCVHPDSRPGPVWRWLLGWVEFVPFDGEDAGVLARLEAHLRPGGVAAVFPEGLPSAGGALARVDGRVVLAAARAGAMVAVAHIDGGQHHRGSPREMALRRRLLPPLAITVLAPCDPPSGPDPAVAARWLGDRLALAWVGHFQGCRTLWQALCGAARRFGRGRCLISDATGAQAGYGRILLRSWVLGAVLARDTDAGEVVGVLLPTTVAAVVTFFALHARGRIPAVLNFTVGSGPLVQACRSAGIRRICTSRRFVARAGLEGVVSGLEAAGCRIVFLEDLARGITVREKLAGVLAACFPAWSYGRVCRSVAPEDAAVILFTSGSEGAPKGVVLSHDNLLSNTVQIQTRVELRADDRMLNVLPMFHAFGLTFGALAPLLTGVASHCFPSPLEYRRVPKLAYARRSTILVSTDTFLSGYGRAAADGDFSAMRHVFAGAEPLREATRRLWVERFGVRILEGYGTTETGPALSINVPLAQRSGSVGRLLPGLAWHLEPVPGIGAGGLLWVRGANVMRGYLVPGGGGALTPPVTRLGAGWYDTGDVVRLDAEGYLYIVGRAKRFAKVGGEMVSLAALEALAASVWPDHAHVAVGEPDPRKGERLVLVTDHPQPERGALVAAAQAQGLGPLHLPGRILSVAVMPRLATGKLDLKGAARLAAEARQAG